MSKQIYITKADKDKLLELIDKARDKEIRSLQNLKDLEAEIKRAEVIHYEDLPENIIGMNSSVVLVVDGVEEEMTLVYPEEADVRKNKISVLSPIGTAILGYSEGSTFEWKVPSGTVQIYVKKVNR
ncbi:GreA/GreB family elongation factor [Lachnospiraceae bacterium MD1]|uniref:GreA/GreB family elongation factor n=1 Tax=Variimorphobacter saccharofermentans TaxID=2755051 RepID=A0A839K469_9FIRM|nr:GreA/GreB family elongation factor [Variimorphobacter saccharofermentans]MBB2183829.1 GreA/GreB family elongation factor [Variimorphobacter saccharofermentans]